MNTLTNFHFIYPFWLLALIPAGILFFLLRRQQEVKSQWRKLIAPHLLPYLIEKAGTSERIRPYRLLVVGLVIAVIALAGPTWQREPSPFTEDEAPLAIALDLSASMNVTDIQPSRLERAKQKIHDLLALRRTGRTALIAYAGSAHLVLPLTEDTSILKTYLADLKTEIMPLPGKAVDRALDLAEKTLAKASVPGSILLITDGISTEQVSAFINHHRQSQNDVVVLGIGTIAGGEIPNADATANTYSRLDRQGLDAVAKQAGAYVTEVTTDATDIRRINQHIQRHLAQVQESKSDRWQNEGYWLLYPLAILILFWFRRGWTIQWLTVFLLATFFAQPPALAASQFSPVLPSDSLTSPPSPTSPPPHLLRSFINLWLTPDQQGRFFFERGNYAEAAERFEDPFWKGVAYYVNEDFKNAIAQFAQLKTPEAYFNLGNAYAHSSNYKTAIKNYERALGMKPDFINAQLNRDIVQAQLEKEQKLKKEREQEQTGQMKPDYTIIEENTPLDKKEDRNQQQKSNSFDTGNDELAELWLRNVQTTPADFLKQKFQYQLEQTEVVGIGDE